MTDILCISTTDWDEIWGSRQQIMTRLASAGHRILFVQRQVGPEHLLRDPNLLRRKLNDWFHPRLEQKQRGIWLWQPPLLPPGRYYSPFLNRLGQRWLSFRLRPVLRSIGFSSPILWLYPPHSSPLIGQFNERLAIYHCIERFAGGQQGRKRQVMLAEEEDLLRKADLVFTHSEGLRMLYQPFTRRPITLIPSAADVAHFQSTAEVHPQIAGIPSPRLGLVGSLDGRIDVNLLRCLAGERPAWQLVLIGQIRPGRVNLGPLLSLPNVHYLGRQPFSSLPAFLNGMDAFLIPYVHNDLTQFISPIKLYEYLAVGKPVISVDLPEVRPLQPWVNIADTPQEFVQAVEKALQEDSAERQSARRKIAWEHTWDKRLSAMWQVITEVLERGVYASG